MLTQATINKFIEEFIPSRYAFSTSQALQSKYWALQKGLDILAEAQLDVRQIAFYPEKFYVTLYSHQYSKNTISKIKAILNTLLQFLQIEEHKIYPPIPPIPAVLRNRLIDKFYQNKKSHAAKPMTEDLLINLLGKIKKKTWNYFFITFYLGLRPSEMQAIRKEGTNVYKLITLEKGQKILAVYQKKLVGRKKEERWKHIPIIEEEQKEALAWLLEDWWELPCAKTLRRKSKYDPDFKNLYAYSGRKGFAQMMARKGYELPEIGRMLGHSALEITLKHYTNTTEISFATAQNLWKKRGK